MKIQFSTLILAAGLAGIFSSCSNDGYKKGDNGLKYKMLSDNDTGRKASVGDLVIFDFAVKNASDSVFMDTKQGGQPFMMKLIEPTYEGCFWEAFTIMNVGDSMQINVVADSFFIKSAGGQMPPFLKPGEEITFFVTLKNVQTEAEMNSAREAEMQKTQAEAAQKTIEEEKIIDDYIAAEKLKDVKKTASGLRYTVVKSASGAQPKMGETVVVHYTGKFLDGKVFDSSVERGQPAEFMLGQVIQGWNEGLQLMKKGEKFKFIIPFGLGYGPQANGPIPAFSTLVFDVELLDIKATPAQPAMPPIQ